VQRHSKARTEEVQRLSKMMLDLQAAIIAWDWARAESLHTQMKSLQPDYPGLADAWSTIEPQWNRLQEQRREDERRRTVQRGIEDGKQVLAKKLCDGPASSAALDKLQLAKAEDAEYKAVQQLTPSLQRCRDRAERKVQAAAAAAERKVQAAAAVAKAHELVQREQELTQKRKELADWMDTRLLREGIEATVRPEGRTLRIYSALCGRVMLYRLLGEIVGGDGTRAWSVEDMLRDVGYRYVRCHDGYSDSDPGVKLAE
jgi:hypothetical protein